MLYLNSEFHIADDICCGDKSISHRALIFAAISDGKCVLRNISLCDDVLATASCLRELGVEISFHGTTAEVLPIRTLPRGNVLLNCQNSGTTARLLAGLAAGLGTDATFVGDESLAKRPMNRILKPLSQMGAVFELSDKRANTSNVLFRNVPAKLRGADIVGEVNSAQVKSGIILAALNACGETVYTEKIATRNHTEILASQLGADVICDGLSVYINKNRTVVAWKMPEHCSSEDMCRVSRFETDIPNDISSVAFIVVLCLLSGESHVFRNVCVNPRRTGFLRVLQKHGAAVSVENSRKVFGEDVADIRVGKSQIGQLFADETEVCDAIDELPALAALAICTKGSHVFQKAGELKYKESDRIRAIIQTAEACGQKAYFDGDLKITSDGVPTRQPNFVTFGDHRIAMSQAVLCLGKCGGGSSDGENFRISFPNFLDVLGIKPLRFALIGNNISQSKSPDLMRYFARKTNICCGYSLADMPQNATDGELLSAIGRYDGCNVTMPFKMRVARLLGAECPSVNTVGKSIAPQSTDGFGVTQSLTNHGIDFRGQKLWILGAGGAAEAAVAALKEFGCEMQIFNRTPERAKALSEKYRLGVVTEPVGFLSFVPQCDFEREFHIPDSVRFIFSAHYGGGTNFLEEQAKQRGIAFVGGLEMLFYQGAKSFSLWTGSSVQSDFRDFVKGE